MARRTLRGRITAGAAASARWRNFSVPPPIKAGLPKPGKAATQGVRARGVREMTTENGMKKERKDDRASDPAEQIETSIRWINEMIKQLQLKTPAKETKH